MNYSFSCHFIFLLITCNLSCHSLGKKAYSSEEKKTTSSSSESDGRRKGSVWPSLLM